MDTDKSCLDILRDMLVNDTYSDIDRKIASNKSIDGCSNFSNYIINNVFGLADNPPSEDVMYYLLALFNIWGYKKATVWNMNMYGDADIWLNITGNNFYFGCRAFNLSCVDSKYKVSIKN